MRSKLPALTKGLDSALDVLFASVSTSGIVGSSQFLCPGSVLPFRSDLITTRGRGEVFDACEIGTKNTSWHLRTPQDSLIKDSNINSFNSLSAEQKRNQNDGFQLDLDVLAMAD